MTENAATPTGPYASRFIYVFAAVILAGVGLYYSFLAVDGVGLSNREGVATVTGKEYREAGTTYSTQQIGDRMQTIPQSVPDAYLLQLDLNGQMAQFPVEKSLYDEISIGDRVGVGYQEKRITGGLVVSMVSRQERRGNDQ